MKNVIMLMLVFGIFLTSCTDDVYGDLDDQDEIVEYNDVSFAVDEILFDLPGPNMGPGSASFVYEISTENDLDKQMPEVLVVVRTLDLLNDGTSRATLNYQTCDFDEVPHGVVVAPEKMWHFKGKPKYDNTCKVGIIIDGCPDGNANCHDGDAVLFQLWLVGASKPHTEVVHHL